ncbi:hypothetical protein Rgna02_01876 [Mediterraneibacter gnavus]
MFWKERLYCIRKIEFDVKVTVPTSHRPYISNLARSALLECASTTIAYGWVGSSVFISRYNRWFCS